MLWYWNLTALHTQLMTRIYHTRVQTFSQKPAVRNHMQQMNILRWILKKWGIKFAGDQSVSGGRAMARFYNKAMHLSVPFKAANFLISCEAITSSNAIWFMVFAICDASFSWWWKFTVGRWKTVFLKEHTTYIFMVDAFLRQSLNLPPSILLDTNVCSGIIFTIT